VINLKQNPSKHFCIQWACYYYSTSWKVNSSKQSGGSQHNKWLVGFIWQVPASALLITKTTKMLWNFF